MSEDSRTTAEAWVIFDRNKICGTRKTDRFDLKAGQRAVKLVLEYPTSLFEDEYPEIKVPLNDKRGIKDREIGVDVGENGQSEVVDPEQYIDELVSRLRKEHEIRGLPRWAFVLLQDELDRRREDDDWWDPEYEALIEESEEGAGVRVVRLLDS